MSPSNFDRQRLTDLEEHIAEDLQLLKEFEEQLRYESNPRIKGQYRSEIERQRESLANHRQEYQALEKQLSGSKPKQMQYVSEQLERMTIQLDNFKLDDFQIPSFPSESTKSPPHPKTPKVKPESGVVRGNYAQLRQLLEQQKWREADQETMKMILKVANRESEKWLGLEHIESFSCRDIQVINKLWLNYSQEQFGFKTQQEIWQNLGGKVGKFDYGVFLKFGQAVGWYQQKEWLKYSDFIFTLDAPKGHLPSLRLPSERYKDWSRNFRGFLTRMAICLHN